VLTKERADDLRRLPLQDCDVLLHEAGAPPIHTPLSVLNELPEKVKLRLYVVHTSALPPECGLRVAPTGTAGTIRLDDLDADDLQNNLMCINSPSYSFKTVDPPERAKSKSLSCRVEILSNGDGPMDYYGSMGSISNISNLECQGNGVSMMESLYRLYFSVLRVYPMHGSFLIYCPTSRSYQVFLIQTQWRCWKSHKSKLFFQMK
jgi:hypothetical protein